MVQRVVYRRQNNFNTKSNKTKIVKTPGGRLTMHVIKKASKGPRCGDCKGIIQGVPALRPFQYKQLARTDRTVARAYGGSRCMACVRDRVKRAFFLEEQKAVKAIIAEKETEARKAVAEKAKAGAEKKSSKSKKSEEKKSSKPAKEVKETKESKKPKQK
jgi:large subunit ribosomal protein L34e